MLHFLSGNGFCGGVYWPLLARMLPEYGFFAHDIEGQGASEAGTKFSGINGLTQRCLAVIDAEKLAEGPPLIGVGHSFGAALTLHLAAARPGLFRALVLLDPIVFPPPMWWTMRLISRLGRHPMAAAARRRRNRWPSRADALAHISGRGIYRGWGEEALACFAAHALRDVDGGVELCCPPEIEAQIYERPLYSWQDFDQVEAPMLFLHGADSYPFFAGASRLVRRRNPRVEVQQQPGEHCFMLEQPDVSARLLREFLGRHL